MQSLMLLKLIAHKGAGDVSHQEMVRDSGRLHFKTKVDQLWGLCHYRSKFKLNWCKKYENLGSFWNECDYQREKLIFVGKTGGRFCSGGECDVCSVNQSSIFATLFISISPSACPVSVL